MRLLRLVLQFLFPSTCVVCGKPAVQLHYICTQQLSPAPPSNHPWILSCFAYRDKRMKKLIKYLKSHEDTALVETFGKCLAKKIPLSPPRGGQLPYIGEPNRDIIISPIPASRDRMKRYGFNQSALLAQSLFKTTRAFGAAPPLKKEGLCSSLEYCDLFIRKKEISKQALIHERKDRLRNPVGAFALKEKYRDVIRDKVIVLVDDVSTTGATLSELRNILLYYHAKEVWAVTVGH